MNKKEVLPPDADYVENGQFVVRRGGCTARFKPDFLRKKIAEAEELAAKYRGWLTQLEPHPAQQPASEREAGEIHKYIAPPCEKFGQPRWNHIHFDELTR